MGKIVLIIIVVIAISLMSYKIIDWLNARGQGILFLQIYFPILATVFLFQSAIICSSVFYFSKDLEYILPLPIKPLELLIANPNKVFTRANLFESVWKDDFMGDDNTVNVHISNLRSKLSKVDKDNEYIQTVWGIGFKLKSE